MKKLLSILLLTIPFIGCIEKRVLIDDLTYKVSKDLMYYEGELFSGIGYDIHSNGQLSKEINYTDGKIHGSYKEWYSNGQLSVEYNINKEGKRDGFWREWYENGQLLHEAKYKDGVMY